MHRIKNHKYLMFLIVINIIVLCGSKYIINKIGYFMFSGEQSNIANDGLIKYFFLWVLLLPLDGLYISKKIYSIKNKRISTISAVLSIVTFFILIDPGFMSIPGRPSGLLRYEIIQTLSDNIPFFFFLLGGTYIILCDILLRFIGNKIISYFTEKKTT